MKTLVIILSETRAHELTYENIKKNLIDELNADLCVCIGIKKDYDYNNPFYKLAKHRFTFEEPDEFYKAFDDAYDEIKSNNKYEICQNTNSIYAKLENPESSTDNIKYLGEYKDINDFDFTQHDFEEIVYHDNNFPNDLWKNKLYGVVKSMKININQKNVITYKKPLPWREFLKIKDQFLGGVGHPGSAGYLIYYRWFLLKNLIEKDLIKEYDRFVITRSDYIFQLPHPKLELLNEKNIWIPDSEQYHGYTDRHVVLNREHVGKYLDLLNCFVIKSHDYFNKMIPNTIWNLEQVIKFHLTEHKIVDKVKEYPYVMYTVRPIDGKTKWSAGYYSPDHGYFIKYRTEFDKSSWYLKLFKESKFLNIDDFYKSIIKL